MENDRSAARHIHLSDFEPISQDVLQALPLGLIHRQKVVPVAMENGTLLVAASDHQQEHVKPAGLKLVAHCPVEVVLAPEAEILAFIEAHFSNSESNSQSTVLNPVVAPIPEVKNPPPAPTASTVSRLP